MDCQPRGKDVSFVAGAYIEINLATSSLYRQQQMDLIVQAGGIPILFQTARLHGQSSKESWGLLCRV
jgi:hypothetical protein